MARETVYADLNIPSSESPCWRPPQTSQHLGLPLWPPWQRITLWVGWITAVILGVTVIVQGNWVSQLVPDKTHPLAAHDGDGPGNRSTPGANCNSCLVEFRSQLKGALCHSSQHGSGESSGCHICPGNWLLHRHKCYWVSKEMKSWHESRDDCLAKHSQLLVIQDLGEMEFIKNNMSMQGLNLVWIGLSVSSPGKMWTWLNGSELNQTWFPLTVQTNGNNCGAMKGNEIQSDSCTTEYEWICQRDTVLI